MSEKELALHMAGGVFVGGWGAGHGSSMGEGLQAGIRLSAGGLGLCLVIKGRSVLARHRTGSRGDRLAGCGSPPEGVWPCSRCSEVPLIHDQH